jgi:hypothetical protein
VTWSQILSPTESAGARIAGFRDGTLYVCGSCEGPIDVGLDAPLPWRGSGRIQVSSDIFFLALDRSGTTRWARDYGTEKNEELVSAHLTSSTIVVAMLERAPHVPEARDTEGAAELIGARIDVDGRSGAEIADTRLAGAVYHLVGFDRGGQIRWTRFFRADRGEPPGPTTRSAGVACFAMDPYDATPELGDASVVCVSDDGERRATARSARSPTALTSAGDLLLGAIPSCDAMNCYAPATRLVVWDLTSGREVASVRLSPGVDDGRMAVDSMLVAGQALYVAGSVEGTVPLLDATLTSANEADRSAFVARIAIETVLADVDGARSSGRGAERPAR